MKKVTTESFIASSKLIYGDLFDYSKVNYIHNKIKIILGCKEHGYFNVVPNKHLSQGVGCPVCGKNRQIEAKLKGVSSFLTEIRSVHGDMYDYTKVDFNRRSDKIKIICKEHGEFEQTVSNHLSGQGCPVCRRITQGEKRRLNGYDFFQRCTQVHFDLYDYSNTSYVGSSKIISPICKVHGKFNVIAGKHLHRKQGCPECSKELTKSKAVIDICKYFDTNGIRYVEEYKIDECKNILSLPFDFYLPDLDVLIEYDGIQHFKPIEYFGGQKGLDEQQYNDNIKNEYCKNTDRTLLRIRYDEDYLKKIKEFLDSWDKRGKV